MRIRVRPNHWARAGHYGTVVDPGEEGLEVLNVPPDRVCVKFDKVGNGINGLYLFLDERDFLILDEHD